MAGIATLTWPARSLTAYGYGAGSAALSRPAWSLHAEGSPSDDITALTWPTRFLTAYGGGSAALSRSVWSLTAAGTVEQIGTAELTRPAWILLIEGLTGSVGTAELAWPAQSLTAHGGGTAELAWSTRTLTAAGMLEIVSTAELSWPYRSLTATGLTGGVGTAVLTWPAWALAIEGLTGGVGTIALRWPTLTLTAVGGGAITETTYAVNLSTGAVTQLLLGAFDKLVTAHGKLYGLRDGALIYLGGDADQGTEIPITIRFAPQQFGTNQAKRINGQIYLNTREDDGMTLTVIEDETESWQYQTDTDAAPAMGTHRVKAGRGITFHSLGFIVQNRNGGRLDIGGLEIPVISLLRRPK